MSQNRVMYALIVLAVALGFAIALDPAIVTKAASQPRGPQSSRRGLSALSAHADALNDQLQADRSYDQIETERGSQVGPAGRGSSGTLDSATRSYMAWAKAIEEQQTSRCLDSECIYQLPYGRWVK